MVCFTHGGMYWLLLCGFVGRRRKLRQSGEEERNSKEKTWSMVTHTYSQILANHSILKENTEAIKKKEKPSFQVSNLVVVHGAKRKRKKYLHACIECLSICVILVRRDHPSGKVMDTDKRCMKEERRTKNNNDNKQQEKKQSEPTPHSSQWTH